MTPAFVRGPWPANTDLVYTYTQCINVIRWKAFNGGNAVVYVLVVKSRVEVSAVFGLCVSRVIED